MNEREEACPAEWLRKVTDAEDRAWHVRAFGWDSADDDELGRELANLAVLGAADDGQLLAAVRGVPRLTRAQKQADRRHQKLFDRARARVKYARVYGAASLAARADDSSRGVDHEDARAGVQGVPGGLMDGMSVAVAEDGSSARDQGEVLGNQKSSGVRLGTGATVASMGPVFAPGCVRTLEKIRPDQRPARGSLEEAIGIEAFEYQKQRWPHLTNSVPRPWWYGTEQQRAWRGRQQAGRDGSMNLFGVPTNGGSRSPDLKAEEFCRLYDAMAFALYQGVVMSTHIVILWESYGVHDHQRAARLLGLFLAEAKKWALVGEPRGDRVRQRPRSGDGVRLSYIYVQENGRLRGFHTHVLCNLPRKLRLAFDAWALAALTRLTGQPGDRRSVRVVARDLREEQQRVDRHWRWFRYVTKGLDPRVELQFRGQPSLGPMRDVMRLWPHRSGSRPVTCLTVCKASQDLLETAQRATNFRSRLAEDAGPQGRQYYDGLELADGRHRRGLDEILSEPDI